jgi:hypothetical protein
MTHIPCTLAGDREETLIAYLYNDIDPQVRATFEVHLDECAMCRAELDDLRGVRAQLPRWNPPAFNSAIADRRSAVQRPHWSQIPAWAQLAAAMLVFGVSAAIANVTIQRDEHGFTIRTGWSQSASATQQASQAARAAADATARREAELRDHLAAVERQLREVRTEQTAAQTASTAKAARDSGTDLDLLRKVRALVDESERRQERELALRLAQAIADMGAQRQADLRKIDLSLNGVQNSLGVEVLKQRQSLNYLMRVNQRQ